MYNKYQYHQTQNRKILHKVEKQWVTISLALFMLMGGGAIAVHHVSANSNQPSVATAVQLNRARPSSISNQAQTMHRGILKHAAIQVQSNPQSVRQPSSTSVADQSSAVATKANDNGLQDLQNLENLLNLLSNLGLLSNNSSQTPTDHRPVQPAQPSQPSDHGNNTPSNQPNSKPSDHQPSSHKISDATKYVLNYQDLLSSDNLKKLENDEEYSYGGTYGVPVKVSGQQNIGGYQFDHLSNPQGSDNNMWIYDGELGNSVNDQSHDIDLNQLQSELVNNYSSAHAAEFLQQMKTYSLNFINQARRANGLASVIENPTLDQLANLRAYQLIQNYSHYTPSGQKYVDVDLAKFNLPDTSWEENIAYNTLSGEGREATDSDTYDEMDGNGMAYAANNNMLNHDAHSNWGHRANMLNPGAKLIGIGSAYDPQTRRFYLAEDFYNSNLNGDSTNEPAQPGHNVTPNNHNVPNDNNSTGNNNNLRSSQSGAVIVRGDNNNINANGSVIVNGDNNNILSNRIVIANGVNNNVVRSRNTILNDTNEHDAVHQEALANGIAIDASHDNNQNVND